MIQSLEKRFMAITWFLTYFTFKGRVTTKYWLQKTSKAHYSMTRVSSLGMVIYKILPWNQFQRLYRWFWTHVLSPKSFGGALFFAFHKILWVFTVSITLDILIIRSSYCNCILLTVLTLGRSNPPVERAFECFRFWIMRSNKVKGHHWPGHKPAWWKNGQNALRIENIKQRNIESRTVERQCQKGLPPKLPPG